MELSENDKGALLLAARESLLTLFKDMPDPQIDYNHYPRLLQKAGAFVTLTIQGQLRGCIGYITSDKSTFDTVCDAAKQAAVGDPRFNPLREEELSKVDIEISVLSPPFKLQSYEEIKLGVHGLIVDEEGRRGLLLPQVPIEHKMTKAEYLTTLCMKAGLDPYLWQKKMVDLHAFTASVFSEERIKEKK